ncbi:hypothetical protein ACHQM5_022929 [Ranunculus cassubicifolius]
MASSFTIFVPLKEGLNSSATHDPGLKYRKMRNGLEANFNYTAVGEEYILKWDVINVLKNQLKSGPISQELKCI